MTNEQKAAAERAAQQSWEQDQKTNPTPVNPHAYVYGYKAGAQTILENPAEWGLMSINQHIKEMGHEAMAQDLMREDIEKFKAQNERYREALERIANEDDEPLSDIGIVEAKWIAKEALKQDDTTCPKCGYPLFKHLGKTCCQGCDYVKQQ